LTVSLLKLKSTFRSLLKFGIFTGRLRAFRNAGRPRSCFGRPSNPNTGQNGVNITPAPALSADDETWLYE
jgi:hypothetical protein